MKKKEIAAALLLLAGLAWAENVLVGANTGAVVLCSANPGRIADYPVLHGDAVYALGASPDGLTAVSGDKDGNLAVWNTETHEGFAVEGAHLGTVRSVSFSPDGSFFVTGAKDRLVKKWDASTGELLETMKGHKSYVYSVTISPDGSTIASVGSDNMLILWDSATGDRLEKKKNAHYKAIYQVIYSSDGETLFTASADNFIKVWDSESLILKETLKGHSNEVTALAVSPDGSMLLSGSRDQKILMWSTSDYAMTGSIPFPQNVSVAGIGFESDGTAVVGDTSGALVDMDLETKRITKEALIEPMKSMVKY